MHNPNPTLRTKAPPLFTSVLKAITDDKALVVFNSIAVSANNDRYVPLKEMNLTSKQYYSRISGLLKVGLIRRQKGVYSLTLLGRVVYDSQTVIGEALSHYWKLKAIETIETPGSNLPAEEVTQLINTLICNPRIKEIIMKLTDVPRDEAKPRIQISTPMITQTQTQSIQNLKGTDRVT